MKNNFSKVKGKFTFRAILYGFFAGIIFSLLAIGLLLLAQKLNIYSVSDTMFIAITAIVAIVAFIVNFIIFNPSPLRMARRVDKRFHLDERAQTMVEFSGQESDMLNYQREDAQKSLSKVKVFKPTFVSAITKLFAVALAVVVFGLGVIMEQVVVVVPVYAVDSTKISKVNSLIEEIKADEQLKTTVKDCYIYALNEFVYELENGGASSESEEQVLCILYQQQLNKYTKYANSYNLFASYLADAEGTPFTAVADLMTTCGLRGVYFGTPTSYSIINSDYTKMTNYNLYGGLYETLYSDFLEEIYAAYESNISDSTYLSVTPYVYLYNSISGLETVLNSIDEKNETRKENEGLIESDTSEASVTYSLASDDLYIMGDTVYDVDTEEEETVNYVELLLNDTDELYEAYSTFLVTLKNVYTKWDTSWSKNTARRQAIIGTSADDTTSALYTLFTDVMAAFEVQAYTYMVDYYVRYVLADIFSTSMYSYSETDGDDETTLEGDDGGDSEDSSSTISNGRGSGDRVVYDPDTNAYVDYADMLNSGYQTNIEEFISSSDLSDELKAYIANYLSNLGN